MPGTHPPIDSVLLIGFGGPTEPEHVLPFLRIVTCGRGVPEARLVEVAHHYDHVGGRSPYNRLTERQRAGLERWLAGQDRPLPVYAGMRNWPPLLPDVVHAMNRAGRRHAVGVILAAHRSESSWERYRADLAHAVACNHGRAPTIRLLDAFFAHPRFLEANAQRIEATTGYRRGAWPAGVPVLFTAHSIPAAMARHAPYEADLRRSCEGVARILGVPDWSLVYQSRSGGAQVPWLEPDVSDALEARARAGVREVVVHAIGFLSDHVEVLYDLDVEARAVCDRHGMRMHRPPCVNDHPEFVAMLGELVLETQAQHA